ncbi:hypothetical protein NA56DRAFT_667601 [Hyaloscypha hepaticicola]|uniref:Uncharacterized protein n=1 Tax=Hyaloscypha hepaticicola TaxID=2082293 RepID=A0A2J6QLY3_9HELO|nr:hypothetical protein NA56DRAFT_667601 [Hyaloscypha hepaticicola]
MHFTTLSVAFFAALATAHQHAAQHFHHRRQSNSTATDPAAQTTLTVFATVIHTVTTAGVATSFPHFTLIPSPSANSSVPTSVSSALGVVTTPSVPSNGSVATPVLSTSTYFQTEVITITSCAASVTNCPARTSTSIYPVETVITSSAEGVAAASSSVVLTYTLGSGTSTTVITTRGGAAGSSGAACAPVTVTVTQAPVTVTVTETASPAGATANSGAAASGGNVNQNAPAPSSTPASGPVVIMSTATVIPVPASTGSPYGNGTQTTVTVKKNCSSIYPSSGFISKARSTGTAPIPYVTGTY